MRRSNCRGCESTQLEKFLDLGNMPLAGGFLAGKEAIQQEKLYPLPVHVCCQCGLVQILEVVDPEVLFKDYSFSSSTIGPPVPGLGRLPSDETATSCVVSPLTVLIRA